MKKFFEMGNKYAKQSDWTDFALVKFCLCAIGIIIGLHIPEKSKKPAERAAVAVFLATYIPLMARLVKVIVNMIKDN